MKRIALLAVLAALSATASAQSSVTLFGIVDANIRNVKNGGTSVTSLSNNGVNSSRLGFRGVEDLGGGLKAAFWLEHGFNIDTGVVSDATRFWNRRATVSLIGNFGEIRLGRDFTPTYLAFSDFDTFGSNGVGATDKYPGFALGTNVATNTRADNEIAYFLPGGLGGFYGTIAAALKEGVSPANGGEYVGGRFGYAAGPLNVNVAYGENKVAANASGGDKYKIFTVAGSYDFGAVKITGFINENKVGGLKSQSYQIGALVPVGAFTFKAAYNKLDASGKTAAGVDTGPNDSETFAIGFLYDLSKRTSLYGTYADVKNKGTAAFTVATPPAAVAGQKSQGYEFGIRHRF